MMPAVDGAFRRVWRCVVALSLVVAGGSVGYVLLGYDPLDAVYQTVATVTTVGYKHADTGAEKAFTILLILVGVGTALFTLGALIEALVEGHVRDLLGRRRMERRIEEMQDHVIICGWGRVGRAIARAVHNAGQEVVVIDRDAERLAEAPFPTVHGDVSDDAVLKEAGIDRARVLVAALNTDADNLYVTVSGRALVPDLFIIARARTESSEPKLTRAGADRVVKPPAHRGRAHRRLRVATARRRVPRRGDARRQPRVPAGGSGGGGGVATGRAHPAGHAHPRPHRRADPRRAQRQWRVRHQPAARDGVPGGRHPHRGGDVDPVSGAQRALRITSGMSRSVRS
jgi:hypothetical protein